MKTTILAAVMLTLAAGTVSAKDIVIGGQTLTIGGDVDANYNTGTEMFAMDLTKKVGVNAFGLDISAEHSLDLMKLNTAGYDLFQGLDLEAGYSLSPSLRTYGKVATDSDFNFGDVTVGASFSF
jgi:opacity protein-like surface antigen